MEQEIKQQIITTLLEFVGPDAPPTFFMEFADKLYVDLGDFLKDE